MSTRANRTLCTIREFIFSPSICYTRISAACLSSLIATSNSHGFRLARKHYHSDPVTHFRNIRPHVWKLSRAPHALKATAQAGEECIFPIGSASSHNNAPETSLSLPCQVGKPDKENGHKVPQIHSGSLSDIVFMRLSSTPKRVTSFTAFHKAPHEESKVITKVVSTDMETCEMSPTLDNGEGYQRAGKEQNAVVDFEGIGSSSPAEVQKTSVDKSPNVQTDEPSVFARDEASVTGARRGSQNKNDLAILKVRRNLLNAARAGDLRSAMNLYQEFTTLANPDVEMAEILIRALCRGTLQAPPHHRILQALQIYNTLLEAEQQIAGDGEKFFDSRSLSSVSEQRYYTRIYNTLLRALSAPLSVKTTSRDMGGDVQEEYTKISMEILAAMEARGLVPDNRTVCSIILLRLRRAANHEEAFELYKSLVTELGAAHARGSAAFDSDASESRPPTSGTQPLLDLQGYRMVLNAFGKLSFPNVPVAPAPLWFAIVNDMREGGYAVTVEDYTIYLGAILAQTTSPFTLHRTAIGFASPLDEEARVEAMLACVKHVHKRLALDVTLAPDPTLLNTLVNAYQHLGAFDEAMKVFNTMWLSGRMDDVTPVIMFDACGHARRPREATMIWCKLVEKGWQFDKRALDTWVECLCRLGNVEAACKFVCMYMGRDNAGYPSKGDTQPDEQTCLILLKLSWVVGQNLDVKEKIRTHLPHIWKNLTAHYT